MTSSADSPVQCPENSQALPELDFLIRDGLILTLSPEYPDLFNGFIGIQGKKIVFLQDQKDPKRPLPRARKTIDASRHLVMPGLVNAHVHAAMSLFRGLADDLPLNIWLEKHIFPAEAGFLSPESIYWGTLLACAEMLLSGTTTCADGYFFMNEAARAYKHSGMRALLCQGVLDFPIPGVADPSQNISEAVRFVDTWEGSSPLLHTGIFCHSPYTCSSETLNTVKTRCREKGVPFFIHLAETREEVKLVQSREGKTPTRYLHSLNLLDSRTVAVHAIHLKPDEIALLAQNRVSVVHCPESNMKLASGMAPVIEMLRNGLLVGLGTDSCASNNDLDLIKEMDTAAKLAKIHYLDPAVLQARKVVEMATRNGAKILGLEHRIGTLGIGMEADLILIPLSSPHLVPCYDPFSLLVYAAQGSDVRSVMVSGRLVVEDRKILSFDLDEVLDRVKWLSRKIKKAQDRRLQ
jgi:5-methylthioadenosine/S-adenosylhomocysteine deaminase